MEFDTSLEFAVILAWKDLRAGDELLSATVEYESRRGLPVDSVTVWALRARGYQDRVCDYSRCASPAHPVGVRFTNSYHSNTLAQALDFIMKNQDQFTRPDDAWRPHLVLIQPPTPELAAEAAAWTAGTEATAAPNLNGGTKAKAGWQMKPRHVSNGAGSHARMTRVTSNSSLEFVDNRSGFPNGPWCR